MQRDGLDFRYYRALNLFAVWKLSWLQKGFDQFAFAADGHAREFLKPAARRDFGFSAQSVGQ